jgi:hypothetical protein
MNKITDDLWIIYKNRIPVDKVKIATSVPRMNPLGLKYKRWWKRHKRKCIEGHWAEHEENFKFVSGPLYTYVNFWRIKLTEKNSKSKGKTVGIPFLRDLEWLRSFVYEEARGFSGYANDEETTSFELFKEVDPTTEPEEFEIRLMEYGNVEYIKSTIINSKGQYKKYISARDKLYGYETQELGKPLYLNMANNVVDMESRGGGKSYWKSLIIGHNFIFDGAVDYDDYLEAKQNEAQLTSESLIGAIEAKYSDDLIAKVKLGLNNLPGTEAVGDKVYPSPFFKKYYGSWDSGKTITAGYDKKIGGVWTKVGSESKIQHRSFNSNHKAANGTRGSVNVIDEVGFMNNLLAVLGQMKEAAADGAVKQGVIWMTGTGGDMEGGSTEQVKAVFYSPGSFNCLEFVDEFEGYQNKIGLFIPAFLTLNQFKDELGNTNYEAAVSYLKRVRAKLKKNVKTKVAYEDETVQRPIVHSEVFLLANNSILPTIDLKEHMDQMMAIQDNPSIRGQNGWMTLTEEGTPKFKLTLDKVPTDYPVNPKDDNTGAVVVWEYPDDGADYGWYVAGNDPYDFDDAPSSASLGSVIIIKRGSAFNGGYDRIVAEYTGRPRLAADFYEQVRRMLIWYGGAMCLYENEKQQIKEHFKKNFSLHLLAYTPGVMKSNETSKTARTRVYGQHMPIGVKKECEIYLREWLLSPIGDGKLQLHTIKSIPLLKELIGYNDTGNFDRVIALMLAIVQVIQMRTIILEESKKESSDEEVDPMAFFKRKHFGTNINTPHGRS